LDTRIQSLIKEGLDKAQIADKLAQERPEIPKDDIRRMVITVGSRETGQYRVVGQPKPPVEAQPPSEAAKPQEGAKAAKETPSEAVPPADIVKIPTGSLVLDPKRFQFKLKVDEKGVSNILKGRKWNPDYAGVISIWYDPADGKPYVVNGHHRVDLARDSNVPHMDARVIHAETAEQARAIGALQNIAEGRGDAVDAAKFFRDTGRSAEDLAKDGITLTEGKIRDGVALSNLAPALFDQVAIGKMEEGRGVAIGEATSDPAQQEAIVKLINKKEAATGKHISDRVVAELGRMVKGAGEHTETQDTLFGVQSMTRNLALEKAEVSDYIRKQTASEKKLFTTVGTEATAQRLGKVGNVITAEENAKIAQQAAQAQELYDRLSVRAGDINDILNRAADELANGENPNAVKQRAYEATRAALSKTLGQGLEDSGEGIQAGSRTGETAAVPAERPAGEPARPVNTEGKLLAPKPELKEGEKNAYEIGFTAGPARPEELKGPGQFGTEGKYVVRNGAGAVVKGGFSTLEAAKVDAADRNYRYKTGKVPPTLEPREEPLTLPGMEQVSAERKSIAEMTEKEYEKAIKDGFVFDSLYRQDTGRETDHPFYSTDVMAADMTDYGGDLSGHHGVQFDNPLHATSVRDASEKLLGRNVYPPESLKVKGGERGTDAQKVLDADQELADAARRAGHDAVVLPREVMVLDKSKIPAGESVTREEWEGMGLDKAKARAKEPTLPGMENVPAERAEAKAGAEGERLTGEVAQPKEDISRKAGEMERESPLFRDTEASGQSGLFGGKLYSGFLDPEIVKDLFPDVAQRMKDWIGDKTTPGDEQRAMMRQTRGEKDRSMAVAMKKLEAAHKEWRSRPREDTAAFANAVESGNIASLPEKDRALAQTFKTAFDEIKSQIQALKPEVLRDYIVNYFPHIWENPSRAGRVIRNMLTGKRPFAGSGRFLKHRSVPTIQDGLDMGLKPVSWNPVDLHMLKYHEMAQFLMGHKTLDMMKEAGTAKFAHPGLDGKRIAGIPEEWERLDDRIGTVYRPETVTPAARADEGELFENRRGENKSFVISGHWYAPPDAAKVFNRFVSTGFAGRYRSYDAAQWFNSNMNALQLGISAFHATTTSVNAATSSVALGIQQLLEGKPVEAMNNIGFGLTMVPSIANTLRNGSFLMREYLNPGSYDAFAREAGAVADAGGRLRQTVIDIKPLDRFLNAVKNRAYGDAAKSSLATIIDVTTRPVMEWYVPRMKFGVFYDMAHNILYNSIKENWPAEKTRMRMQKSWDSVDNRFGQMVYPNLFWDKGWSDLLMLATRSVGWNYGTIRELGMAPLDVIKQTGKAVRGEGFEITDRMAFAFALPILTGMMGASITRLATGQWPTSWKDYTHPRRADGTRLSQPGYMKDVVAYWMAPGQTLINKFGPLVQMTRETLENKDFYGTEIRHKDDPPVKQMLEFSKWAVAQAVPFSIAGSKKLVEREGEELSFDWKHPFASVGELSKAAMRHPVDVIAGELGFQPAAAVIQNSVALNKAREYGLENRPPGTRTKEQAEHRAAMHSVEDMYRHGKLNQNVIMKYIAEGKLTRADLTKAQTYSKTDPLLGAIFGGHLSIEQLLNVYAAANDKEKIMLGKIIIPRQGEIAKIPDPEQRKRVLVSFNRLFGAKQKPTAQKVY
jgi:hypothetical protein